MLKGLVRRALGVIVATITAAVPFAAMPATSTADATSGTLFAITGPSQSTLSRVDPISGVISPIEDLAGVNQGQLGTMTGDAATHRIFAVRTSVVSTPPSQIDLANELLTINSISGSVFVSPTVNVPVGQVGFDPATNTVFGLGPTGIFKVDPVSGDTTTVATAAKLGFSCCGITSMAVVPGGHTIYVNDDAFDTDTGTNTNQIITLDTSSGAVTSSPVVPGSVRIIAFDSGDGGLYGLADCCPRQLVRLDPSSAAESSVAAFSSDPNQGMPFAMAVDPSTHTVFTDLQTFIDPDTTQDQIVSINDQDGTTSVSSPINNNLVWSQYFEVPAPVITAGTVSAEIQAALASGAVSKAGIATSLLAKLRNAQAAHDRGQCATAANLYKAFVNEVSALGDKGIASATAAKLVSDAQVLSRSCP
jgi:hypothetical protein